jgi:hypothetical protein
MSLFDDFRSLAVELFDAFDVPPATITRTITAPRSDADKAAGRVNVSLVNLPARAVLGSRTVRNADGTEHQQATAHVNVEVRVRDKLTVGFRTFEIETVEEINPDGTGAIIYVAGLK